MHSGSGGEKLAGVNGPVTHACERCEYRLTACDRRGGCRVPPAGCEAPWTAGARAGGGMPLRCPGGTAAFAAQVVRPRLWHRGRLANEGAAYHARL